MALASRRRTATAPCRHHCSVEVSELDDHLLWMWCCLRIGQGMGHLRGKQCRHVGRNMAVSAAVAADVADGRRSTTPRMELSRIRKCCRHLQKGSSIFIHRDKLNPSALLFSPCPSGSNDFCLAAPQRVLFALCWLAGEQLLALMFFCIILCSSYNCKSGAGGGG